MHARPIRPDAGPTDRSRLTAAGLSALFPGLGQLQNGRPSAARLFAVPVLILIAIAGIINALETPTQIGLRLLVPTTLILILILNLLVLAWRLIAVGHAFFDNKFRMAPGRNGAIGLVVLALLVALPHVIVGYYGVLAYDSTKTVFGGSAQPPLGGEDDDPGSPIGPTPKPGERVNILLMGVDSGPNRAHALADTLIVVSLDQVGKTVSMVSVPRDMVDVPLGNGETFAPKINSLLGYANTNREEFPNGGTRALQDAIGALLDIQIHYYAKVDLGGFVDTVNAVGGIDVTVKRKLADPDYGGFGVGPGWSIEAGEHHLDGPNALAYARIRKSTGESDFTRAERQQQVLLALRDRAIGQNLLLTLPTLLGSLKETVRTDFPAERLPEFAALAQEIGGDRTTQVVIRSPLVQSGGPSHPYGSVQVPDVEAIQAMAKLVFSAPGTPPTPWPTPKPTKAPRPSPSP